MYIFTDPLGVNMKNIPHLWLWYFRYFCQQRALAASGAVPYALARTRRW